MVEMAVKTTSLPRNLKIAQPMSLSRSTFAGCTRSAGHANGRHARLAHICLPCALLAFAATPRLAPGQVAATFQISADESYLEIVPADWGTSFFPISGTMFAQTTGVIPQSPGSLRTGVSGVLVGTISGNSFTVAPGSRLAGLAHPSSPFLPSTAATGSPGLIDNFGGLAVFNAGDDYAPFGNGHIALRDAEATLLSGSVSIGSTSQSLTFAMTSGVLDYDLGFPINPPTGSQPLATVLPAVNNDSQQAVTGSFDSTIRIPYELTFAFDLVQEIPNEDSRLVMKGLVVATRVADSTPGDFNGDRHVNGQDLAVWQGAYGAGTQADADGDSDSDGADFLVWQRSLAAAAASGSAVPEPASWLIAAAACQGVIATGRRRSL
jgi:hypothetical protein